MKRLTLITDAWLPQLNGVVRTLQTTIDLLESQGWTVTVIHPGIFTTFPMPGYAEIAIPLTRSKTIQRLILDSNPDYIHISTEGVLGWAARKACITHNMRFTSAYHTMFPEFIQARTKIPTSWTYPVVRKFHNSSAKVFVATPQLANMLGANGITAPTSIWSRGIDLSAFSPSFRVEPTEPYALYVGRISHEKQIEHFLKAKTKLKKVVVGDGPQLSELKAKYPVVTFLGAKRGHELSVLYASAEVFVFPSVSDTFGLVLIEALASGTPVAAYPADNCKAIMNDHVCHLDNDLSVAIEGAQRLNRTECAAFGSSVYSWERATNQFSSNLVPTKS